MHHLDLAIFRAIYAGPGAHGALFILMVGLTIVGSGWTMLPLLGLVALPRTRRFAAWLIGALLVTALAVVALKAGFGRVRPCGCVPGVACLFGHAPTDPSFPSGHAAGAFTLAAFVIARWRGYTAHPVAWRVLGTIGLVAAAAGIALSRVYLGVHFPGDVAAGAAVGTTIGTLVAGASVRRGATTPASTTSDMAS